MSPLYILAIFYFIVTPSFVYAQNYKTIAIDMIVKETVDDYLNKHINYYPELNVVDSYVYNKVYYYPELSVIHKLQIDLDKTISLKETTIYENDYIPRDIKTDAIKDIFIMLALNNIAIKMNDKHLVYSNSYLNDRLIDWEAIRIDEIR